MIKFPQVHIAESVENRILRIAEGLAPAPAPAATREPAQPAVPNTAAMGSMLDAQLSQPLAGPMPGIDQAPNPGGTIQGKPLLDTILEPTP